MTNSGRRAPASQTHASTERSATKARRPQEITAHDPPHRPPPAIMHMQRDAGNRATSELIQRTRTGRRADPAMSGGTMRRTGNTPVALQYRQANRTGWPIEASWRARLQNAFGIDLADVRVHTDAVADAVQATALTRGRDIHLAREAPPPGSVAGRALLAHEVAHVVQQGQTSGVRSGAVGLPGDRFEQAADAAAHAVMAGSRVQPMPTDAPPAVQHQRAGTQPDLLRELLAEIERRGIAYDLDKGLLVGGVPVQEVPRGADC